MAVDRVEIDGRGVKAILNSGGVQAQLRSLAQAKASAAGPGVWTVVVESGPNRARAAVITGDWRARRREATERALSRAVGGRA